MAPALTLNPQCNILCLFYRKLLLVLKINQNIPQSLLHIPHHMGGFGLQALEVEQGIKALVIIVRTYTSNLLTSTLFKQSLEYIQLKVGIDFSVFNANFKIYGRFAIEGWIKSVWRFIDFYYLHLTLLDIHHLFSLILNDKTIMSVVIAYQVFNKKTL